MLNNLQQKVTALLSENASAILTAGGVVGTVSTAIFAGRAGYIAADMIADYDAEQALLVEPYDLNKTEKFKMTWQLYIPPVITGGATIGSIVLANRMSAQKAAALAAAYGLSERQLREYKEKVAEKFGVTKTKNLQDDLAQERVGNTPGGNQIIVVEGEVLCFDQPTGRYFRSTMERINRAVNRVNEEILHHDHASANFFYEELGMAPTTWGDDVGWNTDQLVELSISTVMSQDERPCIAIDFKYLPKTDYVRSSY